jgi:hypothetical protein
MPLRRPPLTIKQILTRADSHHVRTGEWPGVMSGHVLDNLNEKWLNVNNALRLGLRTLEGGESLARLLDRERGVRNLGNLPPLTEDQIVAWARAYYEQTGAWPNENSGPIPDSRGEDWANVNQALRDGDRGLPGVDTLARLLARRLSIRNRASMPRLTIQQILAWARQHHARTGEWPQVRSGQIQDAPGETWCAVEEALRYGRRGLKGGSSLAQLLARRLGVRNWADVPPRWSQREEARRGRGGSPGNKKPR